MTIGPDPMIKMEWMSVRLGIRILQLAASAIICANWSNR